MAESVPQAYHPHSQSLPHVHIQSNQFLLVVGRDVVLPSTSRHHHVMTHYILVVFGGGCAAGLATASSLMVVEIVLEMSTPAIIIQQYSLVYTRIMSKATP